MWKRLDLTERRKQEAISASYRKRKLPQSYTILTPDCKHSSGPVKGDCGMCRLKICADRGYGTAMICLMSLALTWCTIASNKGESSFMPGSGHRNRCLHDVVTFTPRIPRLERDVIHETGGIEVEEPIGDAEMRLCVGSPSMVVTLSNFTHKDRVYDVIVKWKLEKKLFLLRLLV